MAKTPAKPDPMMKMSKNELMKECKMGNKKACTMMNKGDDSKKSK